MNKTKKWQPEEKRWTNQIRSNTYFQRNEGDKWSDQNANKDAGFSAKIKYYF